MLRITALILLMNSYAFAGEIHSKLNPNGQLFDGMEDLLKEPVKSTAYDYDINKKSRDKSNFKKWAPLVKYSLPSPYQDDAGTCLFMSHTGIVEWWLARLNPHVKTRIDGPFDLSERYSVAMANDKIGNHVVNNWITDTIYRFNVHKEHVRNKYYPFAKGWFSYDNSGNTIKARANSKDAKYGAQYNWASTTKRVRAPSVPLPEFQRHILFADPEKNQWNTLVTPRNIVAEIKEALHKRKAPVEVIYNHYGYWHAVYILGYDDGFKHNCKFVKDYPPYLRDRILKLKKKYNDETNPQVKAKIKDRIEYFIGRGKRFMAALKKKGCRSRGVFIVRDSLQPDKNLPLYDYDKRRRGEEVHYSKRYVAREYEWVEYFANHVYQITAQY